MTYDKELESMICRVKTERKMIQEHQMNAPLYPHCDQKESNILRVIELNDLLDKLREKR